MRISDWSSDVCSSDLLHHHFADSLGLHLTFAAGFKLALDSGDEFFHADRIDRSLAAGDLHGTGQLFAVERLATAFTLDHPKIPSLNALEGREAGGAAFPLPPPDYCPSVPGCRRAGERRGGQGGGGTCS